MAHYKLLAKSNESGAGRRLCFWVVVADHATRQASEPHKSVFDAKKNVSPPVQTSDCRLPFVSQVVGS